MKILFITGHSRSGSSLLNVFLGKSPNILALGEIVNSRELLKKRLLNESCSCNAKDCNFWQGFSSYLDNNSQLDFKQSLVNYVEDEYPDKRIIVDSSKDIDSMMFWLELKKNRPDIKIYVIHLVRDIRGWSYSHYKRNEAQMPKKIISLIKNLYSWYRQNKEFDLVLNKYPGSFLRIGYEEFIFYRKQIVDMIFSYCNETNFISEYSFVSDSLAHELSNFSKSIVKNDINYDFYWMSNWPCSFIGFVNPAIFKMNKKYVYGNLRKRRRITEIPK